MGDSDRYGDKPTEHPIDPALCRWPYEYPTEVKGSEVEAFLRTIGVSPVELSTLAEIVISPAHVMITRYRLDNDGHRFLTSPNGDVASQVTTCRLAWGK